MKHIFILNKEFFMETEIDRNTLENKYDNFFESLIESIEWRGCNLVMTLFYFYYEEGCFRSSRIEVKFKHCESAVFDMRGMIASEERFNYDNYSNPQVEISRFILLPGLLPEFKCKVIIDTNFSDATNSHAIELSCKSVFVEKIDESDTPNS
jgi:hypothetical protein